MMKVVESIKADQNITLIGSTIIEGSIGTRAIVKVINGALIIKGNIESGAQISVCYDMTSITNEGHASISGGSYGNASRRLDNCSSFLNVEVHDVGDDIKIETSAGSITAKKLGQRVQLIATNGIRFTSCKSNGNFINRTNSNLNSELANQAISISAENIGQASKFRSDGEIRCGNLASTVEMWAKGSIHVNEMKRDCRLYSGREIKVGNIGAKNRLLAGSQIVAKNIGEGCELTSKKKEIYVENVGFGSTIKAKFSIFTMAISDNVHLYSEISNVDIKGDCGAFVKARANSDIALKNARANADIKSYNGTIFIRGDVGNNPNIKARLDITLSNVGNNAKITSETGSITIADIGVNGILNAEKTIVMRGTCPDRASLISNLDIINRPANLQAPYVRTPHLLLSAAPILITNQQSNYQNISGRTAVDLLSFSPKREADIHISQDDSDEIPTELLCPISLNLMEDPVYCSLDNRIYDRQNITKWLSEHKTSPFNRQQLPIGRDATFVLTPHFDVAEKIAKYKSEQNKKLGMG